MVLAEKLITAEEFLEIAAQQENMLELAEGAIIEMPPSSLLNSFIAMRIGHLLSSFVNQYNLGYVFGADGGYTLSPHNVRVPDVSFVSKQRFPTLPDKIEGAPDLAIEVVSPSESARSVMNKAELYLQAGARLVWLVYPEEQVIDVIRPAEAGMLVQKFTLDGTLDGGEVLPGFSLPLNAIFPPEDQTA